MNKREKKLLAVTMLVCVAGALTFWGRSSKPDSADAKSPDAATKAPESKATPKTAATAKPTTPAATAPAPKLLGIRFDPAQLRSLLDEVDTPGSAKIASDLFRGGVEVDPMPTRPRPDVPVAETVRLPELGAIFFSSASDQGAVLDGHVCFLGELHREFRLLRVDAEGVTLEREGRTYRVLYGRPKLSGPVNGSEEER